MTPPDKTDVFLSVIESHKRIISLASLVRLKPRGIIIVVVYLILLGVSLFYAISHYSPAANYFIISIGAIFLINVRALYDYIKHLVWIHEIDYDGSITDIQLNLSRLQFSIINHVRIMCLQFPFWTTFYLSGKWFPQDATLGVIIFQVLLTASFMYLGYWLYKNINIENLDRIWFRKFIAGSGGRDVLKALEFYKELEEFKKGRQTWG